MFSLICRTTLVSFANSSASEQAMCLQDWVAEVGKIQVGNQILVLGIGFYMKNLPWNNTNRANPATYNNYETYPLKPQC